MEATFFKRTVATLTSLVLLFGLHPLSALAAEDPIIAGSSESAALGIIGGADGPTVIFVSGNWWILPLGLAAIVAAVIFTVVILKKRRK